MVKKFQLKNGLKVLLIQSRKAPVVSVQMWVRTGSADERKGEEGISHFIEHLVFKGSQEFKTGEIAKVVEGSGGELNAYTSFDQTVFYVTISSAFQSTGLRVIREMMGFPAFDENEINNEREVVIEEIKRSMDSPHREASRELFQTVYKKHAYGIPVIGYTENIRTVSRKKLVGYYADRYSPANMTLVIAGDFEEKDMRKMVDEHFGVIPKTKVRKITRKVEPKQKTPRINVKKTKFNETYLYLSWPGVNIRHKDAMTLDLMTLIFGQGDSSWLQRRLRNELGIVQSIGASSYSPKDKGLVAISAALNHKNLQACLDEILVAMEQVLTTPPEKAELIKAARAIESEKFYSLETVDGMSQLMGSLDFHFGDTKEFDRMMKKIDATAGTDLVKVARTYFDPKTISIIYLSKDVTPATKKVLADFQKSYAKLYARAKKVRLKAEKPPKRAKIKWNAKAVGQNKPKPKRIELSDGARLLLLPSKDSPTISMKTGFLGGLRVEHERHQGVNELLSRVWTSGTATLNEYDIHSRIESIASSISAFGGRNTTGLSMTTLNAFYKDAFSVFVDIFQNPSFPAEAVEREKSFMLEHLKNRDDNPARICILKMMQEMFGHHPYHRDPYGTQETVATLNRDVVAGHWKRLLRPENLVFSVVGEIDQDDLVDQLQGLVKSLPGKTDTWPPLETFSLPGDRRVFVEQNKEQTHICLAYPGLILSDKKKYTLDLLQSVLAGQGGRLFLELRDKASLAYTVAPMRMDGLDGGYFGTYIGCSPEKSEKAVAMMREELRKLQEAKVPKDELERSKRYIMGRHDIALQKNSSVANEMLLNELYRQPYDEYLTYSDTIRAVTAEDILDLAQEIFGRHSVLSVVGPRDV